MGDCVSRSNCCDDAFFYTTMSQPTIINFRLNGFFFSFFGSENFLLNGKSQVSSFYKPNTKKFQAFMGIYEIFPDRRFLLRTRFLMELLTLFAVLGLTCHSTLVTLSHSRILYLFRINEMPLISPTLTHSHSGLHTVSFFLKILAKFPFLAIKEFWFVHVRRSPIF